MSHVENLRAGLPSDGVLSPSPSTTVNPFAHNPIKVAWRRQMLKRRAATRELDATAPPAAPPTAWAPRPAARPAPIAPVHPAWVGRMPMRADGPTRAASAKDAEVRKRAQAILAQAAKRDAQEGNGRGGMPKNPGRVKAPAKNQYAFLCCRPLE